MLYLCVCVFVHVLFSFAYMCAFEGRSGFIDLQVVFVFSHKSKSNLYLCGSLRVKHTDGKSERDGERCETGVGGRRARLNDHRENITEELFLQ